MHVVLFIASVETQSFRMALLAHWVLAKEAVARCTFIRRKE